MKIISLLFLTIFILSCSSEEVFPDYSDKMYDIVGEWKLYEYCDGEAHIRCSFEKADFTKSFSFLENGNYLHQDRANYLIGTYIIEDFQLQMNIDSISNQDYWGNYQFYHYRVQFIDMDHVSISPECFEGCTHHYQRVQ